MKLCPGLVLSAAGISLVVFAAGSATAQVNPRDLPIVAQSQQRFDSGQDIQPVYEGWMRNDDGSYTLHFGYFNRNYREQSQVPVGPSNYFSPGEVDRGQPTYFYPRTQRYAFTVQVPATMGTSREDGLVWRVTHNGSEQQAIGWLQPEWEIDENTITSLSRTGFGRGVDELFSNVPPEIAVEAAASTVAVGQPLKLTAILTDDALPTEKPARGQARSRLPSLTPPDDAAPRPDNVRWYRKARPPQNGLSVEWVVYRGPDDAEFNPAGFQRSVQGEGGDRGGYYESYGPLSDEPQLVAGDGWTSATFETAVTFDTPGTYTLRAYGCDAMMITPADLTVTVTRSH